MGRAQTDTLIGISPPLPGPLTPAREREPELDDAPDFGPSSGSIDEVDPGFEFDQSVLENDCP
jgi:hypothetical protein